MKRFMEKALSPNWFFIYDIITFCELLGEDKIFGFYGKKLSIIICFIIMK